MFSKRYVEILEQMLRDTRHRIEILEMKVDCLNKNDTANIEELKNLSRRLEELLMEFKKHTEEDAVNFKRISDNWLDLMSKMEQHMLESRESRVLYETRIKLEDERRKKFRFWVKVIAPVIVLVLPALWAVIKFLVISGVL